MSLRISPAWWPVLAVGSPVLGPWLVVRNQRFRHNCNRAAASNQERIANTGHLEMPELDHMDLTVLVEWKTRDGFTGDAGVSYVFRTELGAMLYDVGFGPTRPALGSNATRLGFNINQVDALAISHLHSDHIGGLAAQRLRQVTVPENLLPTEPVTCFLPDRAEAKGFRTELVQRPRLLTAGIASTGPLARSLFVQGYTEEQALVARIKGKGLVVFTGCGHPTIQVVLEMVKRLSDEPIYAIGGGLHFPLTDSRINLAGIQFQRLIGTGKPPWRHITEDDLSQTIAAINSFGPKKVFLSGHDTCDYSLKRMISELHAETEVLEAGATYRF